MISFKAINFRIASLRLASLFVILLLCSAALASQLINGAGATFPYPLYSKWFSEYQKIDPKTQINYQSIGSGGGIRQFTEKTVDFGATDTPMSQEQLNKSPESILHIPTVLGAVALTYHITGVPKSGLKLTPSIISDLFLGKIQKWNDPKIAQLNPQISLPDESVIIVRRSDGSGTTAVFTDYLSKVSPEWKQKVGSATSVRWPVGLGGKGNEGIAGLIKQTPGTLGYVELVYAENNHLSYAAIQNKSGDFILPTVKAVTAAADSMKGKIPEDFRVSITDPAGKNAYPISSFTYILVYAKMAKEKGQSLVQFLHWAMKDGQSYAENLHYSPLPQSLAKRVDKKISEISLR